MTREQFEQVNGFSNKYFGWGGEDDDMYNRLVPTHILFTMLNIEVDIFCNRGELYMYTKECYYNSLYRSINLHCIPECC